MLKLRHLTPNFATFHRYVEQGIMSFFPIKVITRYCEMSLLGQRVIAMRPTDFYDLSNFRPGFVGEAFGIDTPRCN